MHKDCSPARQYSQVPSAIPGLIITRSPGRTARTSAPIACTTPAPSAPRMWGKAYWCGSPRTTNKSRRLSAAARSATRTSRGPKELGGSGTSASCSWSRPPVARITQARMRGRRLRHEGRGHHLLGAGRRHRHGRAARPDRLDVHFEHVLLHRDDEAQEVARERDAEIRGDEVGPAQGRDPAAGELRLHHLRGGAAPLLLLEQVDKRAVPQEVGRALLGLRPPREDPLVVPSFAISQMWVLPSRFETKAMVSPSGDMLGCELSAGSRVSCAASELVIGWTKICRCPVRFEWNTTACPSAVNDASSSKPGELVRRPTFVPSASMR